MRRRRSRLLSSLLLAILALGIAAPAFAAHPCCCEAMIGAAGSTPCDAESSLSSCCAPPTAVNEAKRTTASPAPETGSAFALSPAAPIATPRDAWPRTPDRPLPAATALACCILRL